MDLISKKMTEILVFCKENKIPVVMTVFYEFKEDGAKYRHDFIRPEDYGFTLKNNYVSDYINEISNKKTDNSENLKNADFKIESAVLKTLKMKVIDLSLICKQCSVAMAFGSCIESDNGKYGYFAQVVSLRTLKRYIRNDKISLFIREMCGYEQEKMRNMREENSALENMQREFSDFSDMQTMFSSGNQET